MTIRAIISAVCATTLVMTGTASVASASADADTEQIITTNQRGIHDGCFYWFWQDMGDASMTLRPGGYSARWSAEINNFIGGKGWETGGPRTFSYSATFEPGRNSYLALYGWTEDPLVEYYILENWGTYRPSGASMGTMTSEHGTYDIYREQIIRNAVEQPVWYRYWSIRREKRSSGTINTADHFAAWARAGMGLGTHNFMVMATEGYQSAGSSDVTMDCADAEPSGARTSPTPVHPAAGRTAAWPRR